MTKKEKKWFSLSKNLNWEILTKNLVSFKDGIFILWGNVSFRRVEFTKKQYIGGIA